jgi:hypothetical protein
VPHELGDTTVTAARIEAETEKTRVARVGIMIALDSAHFGPGGHVTARLAGTGLPGAVRVPAALRWTARA